jgi:hypothetical protein
MIAVAILAAGSMIMLASADASARGWGYGAHGGRFQSYYRHSFVTPGWSHSASVNRAPGQVSGMRSFHTPNGGGATRTFNRGCSGGTCTHNASITTNSGKTWTRSGTISTNHNGTASRTQSATGPNASASRIGSCTTGAGCSSTASLTGTAGTTITGQRSTTSNGQGGYNRNATYTGPNGSVTRSFQIP